MQPGPRVFPADAATALPERKRRDRPPKHPMPSVPGVPALSLFACPPDAARWAPNGSTANVSNATLTEAQWQALGYNRNGLAANPAFTNPAAGDYSVGASSPTLGRSAGDPHPNPGSSLRETAQRDGRQPARTPARTFEGAAAACWDSYHAAPGTDGAGTGHHAKGERPLAASWPPQGG